MPIVDILVPQMGEGLQEVLIVELEKKPGESIRRDEPIYHMETDKATMEVESPFEGVLVEWLAHEGDTVPIGAPIARIEVIEAATVRDTSPPTAEAPSAVPASDARERNIPPRTRAYARAKNISDDDLARISPAGSKLMPTDIDDFLAHRAAPPVIGAGTEKTPPDTGEGQYVERSLSKHDRTFIYRLKRSAAMVIPAVAKRQMDWGRIRAFADARKSRESAIQPTAFQCAAWCIGQAVREHPKFRSTLVREDAIREFAHLNMGIAVTIPTGELTLAVVPEADTLGFDAFVQTAQERIQAARQGEDQADEATHLLLTYMGPYEITDAVPVLVAPAAAVLFIGSAFEQAGRQVVNLVLTFDHRLIHGVEAAEFLRTIVHNASRIEEMAAG